jgi:PTH2 family peptidyl-tRNA hydrolase
METKQVIIIRKDLNMRKGKMVAQGAHASMAALLDLFEKEDVDDSCYRLKALLNYDWPASKWLEKSFTKICVYVNSEDELLQLYAKAKEKWMLCSLIKDNGTTEFNGIPTYTSVAIGPDEASRIDEITGDLPLL